MTIHETYLEISGRLAGKTERLAEVVEKHVEASGVALVVVHKGLVDHMREKLPDTGVVVIPEHLMHSKLVTGIEPQLKNVRWFFDEFDWLKNVPVKEGAYYCTTARYLRKQDASAEGDTLLTLVKKLGKPSLKLPSPISKEDAAEHYANETERALLFEAQYMEPPP